VGRIAISDLIDLVALSLVVWAQWRIGAWILARSHRQPAWIQKLARILLVLGALLLVIGFAFAYNDTNRLIPIPLLRGLLSGGT